MQFVHDFPSGISLYLLQDLDRPADAGERQYVVNSGSQHAITSKEIDRFYSASSNMSQHEGIEVPPLITIWFNMYNMNLPESVVSKAPGFEGVNVLLGVDFTTLRVYAETSSIVAFRPFYAVLLSAGKHSTIPPSSSTGSTPSPPAKTETSTSGKGKEITELGEPRKLKMKVGMKLHAVIIYLLDNSFVPTIRAAVNDVEISVNLSDPKIFMDAGLRSFTVSDVRAEVQDFAFKKLIHRPIKRMERTPGLPEAVGKLEAEEGGAEIAVPPSWDLSSDATGDEKGDTSSLLVMGLEMDTLERSLVRLRSHRPSILSFMHSYAMCISYGPHRC